MTARGLQATLLSLIMKALRGDASTNALLWPMLAANPGAAGLHAMPGSSPAWQHTCGNSTPLWKASFVSTAEAD